MSCGAPLAGRYVQPQSRSGDVKPDRLRFTFLFWWWALYFGLLDVRRPPLRAALVRRERFEAAI